LCVHDADLYETEIFVFDITAPTIYEFGAGSGYVKRVFLIFWGEHYDALAFQPSDAKLPPQEFFSVVDEAVMKQMKAFAEQQHARQFSREGQAVSWVPHSGQLGGSERMKERELPRGRERKN
jgi:hypothetical protein